MRAKDVLLEALEKFSGTVVFVSHDRYFIDKLATRVFEVGDGRVHVYPGNYEDYLWRKEGGHIDLELPAAPDETNSPAPAPAPPATPKARVNPMKLRKLQDRCQELEARVGELEGEIARHEASLAEFHSAEESIRTAERIEALRSELAQLTNEWEDVAQSIEAHRERIIIHGTEYLNK
jgi:ATP-binding cassette subfamily F protein 3